MHVTVDCSYVYATDQCDKLTDGDGSERKVWIVPGHYVPVDLSRMVGIWTGMMISQGRAVPIDDFIV